VNKERISEKIKNDLLNRKKKKEKNESYHTAQKIVKDYREKQKSHSNFKRKVLNTKFVDNFYDESREGNSVIVIRICGYVLIYKFFRNLNRISKEISNILIKLKLKRLYSAILMKYDRETFQMLTLIEPYITWG
jgi:large subunit ribosomal protein L7e